MKNVETLLIFR